MTRMEYFQTYTNDTPQLNAYQGQVWPVTGPAIAYAPSQEYTYSESSIVVNLDDENAVYDQDNSANTIVFAPN